MSCRIDHGTFFVLTMNFNQSLANLFKQRHTHRLIIDVRTGTTIGVLGSAQNDTVLSATIGEVVFLQQLKDMMVRLNIKNGADLPLLLANANQITIPPRAKRQRQGVQQDRFTRTRFARQHRQTTVKFNIQLTNEHDIAYGKN